MIDPMYEENFINNNPIGIHCAKLYETEPERSNCIRDLLLIGWQPIDTEFTDVLAIPNSSQETEPEMLDCTLDQEQCSAGPEKTVSTGFTGIFVIG